MAKAIEYREAVEYAVRYLDDLGIHTAGPDMLRQLRFRFAAKAGISAIDLDGNRLEPDQAYENKSVDELAALFDAPKSGQEEARYRLVLTGEDEEVVERLMELSKVSTVAFDALIDIAASVARNGLPYCGLMREWVAGYLQGKIKRTGRTGRMRAETLGRDLYVLGAIYELIEQGMSATRNDASAPASACDAVSDALRRLDIPPRSYASVKRIWLNAERVMSYL